jgi:hypothetical protein
MELPAARADRRRTWDALGMAGLVALAAALTAHSQPRLGWALAWLPVVLGLGVLTVLVPRLRRTPTPLLIGAIAFTLLASVSARRASYRPEGDEPWYLVQADSLVHDGDLDTPMEEASARSAWFFGEPLRPPGQVELFGGTWRVPHWPATALFLIPAALLHARIVGELTLALLVALALAQGMALFARRAGSQSVGAGLALLLGVASPLTQYGLLFFPDGIAAHGPRSKALGGLLLALLVALRPSLILLVPGAFIAAEAKPDRQALGGLGVGLGIFAVSQAVLFGGLRVQPFALDLVHAPAFIAAAIVEPGRGLLLNHPLWIALGGLGLLLPRSRLLVAVAAAGMAPAVLFAQSAGVGGWCPAARFWTPIVPLLAAALSAAWPDVVSRLARPAWRWSLAVLLLISCATGLAGDLFPFWSFNDGTHWLQKARSEGPHWR